ncbi:FAD-binding oxidoreductase [Pseudonocardia xinjiangensis]|uniref:FAD-binding oxidoreductase n=1 Tax=Pseudonocardia xinjiangensis TaxID=75289 RepID=UPI003D8CA33B
MQHGLPVAVVCTGHQPFEPVQGAVLITTSRMDAVEIDVAARTARTGAGAVWQQVVDAAAPAGLAPLNGSSAKVGVTGYVLGGGLSPTLGRTYGWAADHVRAIEIVTADGELRRVTATAEPELFWAVRGAKGNFGVVTAMEIDLFPVSTYFGGGLFYAGEHTEAVLRAYREWITTAPDELSSSVALLRLPPSAEVPAPLRGRLAVHVRVCFLGPAVEGERLVAPLRALAPTIIDTVMPTPYRAFASVHQDPVDPVPLRMRNALLTGLTDEVVDALVAFGGPGSGCGLTVLEVRHLGAALARPAAVPSAVDARDAGVSVWGAAIGPAEATAPAIAQLDRLITRLRPWSTGRRYLNFMSGADGAECAYTAQTYQRLRTVKRAYDPGNVFRLNNHNIPPA